MTRGREPGHRSFVVAALALSLVLASCASAAPDPAAGAGGTPRATRAAPGSRWAPVPGQPWQWQLTTPVDTGVDVAVYDVDGFDNSAAVVAGLHAAGRHVICYVDVGGWESYRPDVGALPARVLGKAIDGWPQERWVDIRRLDVVGPAIAARFDMCRAKGFDAVEPDVLDAYANDSGFPLSADDQLRFNSAVAALAHARGMSVALKGDAEQARELASVFDFTINEQCAQYDECDLLRPFVDAGKAVLHVEYDVALAVFCPLTTRLGFASMRKRLSLDAWRAPCP